MFMPFSYRRFFLPYTVIKWFSLLFPKMEREGRSAQSYGCYLSTSFHFFMRRSGLPATPSGNLAGFNRF